MPQSNYAISKCEAEITLSSIAEKSHLEVVVIRPPAVYGPGVKGNFANLVKLVKYGIPLPFLSVENQRSFISIDNLNGLIELCIEHPRVANKAILVSDGRDLSTRQLICEISSAIEQPARLFHCPKAVMENVGKVLRKNDFCERLFGSLQIDTAETQSLLGWLPDRDIQKKLREYFK